MSATTQNQAEGDEPESALRSQPDELAALARELVDKVGVEGAMRYCHGLGWLGVLDQVKRLDRPH